VPTRRIGQLNGTSNVRQVVTWCHVWESELLLGRPSSPPILFAAQRGCAQAGETWTNRRWRGCLLARERCADESDGGRVLLLTSAAGMRTVHQPARRRSSSR